MQISWADMIVQLMVADRHQSCVATGQWKAKAELSGPCVAIVDVTSLEAWAFFFGWPQALHPSFIVTHQQLMQKSASCSMVCSV